MPSEKTNLRRAPKQQRAGERVDQVLEASAIIMAESGYDATTMTAIAQRAGASIGAIYQYFPNKQAIVLALRDRYREEMSNRLVDIEAVAATLTVKELAWRLIENTRQFVDAHPAYFHVIDLPFSIDRNEVARVGLRHRIAAIIWTHEKAIPQQDAFLMASVVIQVIKSMNPLYIKANVEGRLLITHEYNLLLTSYLQAHLSKQSESSSGSGFKSPALLESQD